MRENYHALVGIVSRFYHSSIEVVENLVLDDFKKYFNNVQNAVEQIH
ncbi:hypothetical protein AVBRAN9334_07100 [Campylobacter sp. RM9334]|nr:hypothetical protein [Campylobacter sp. RM9334]